MKKLVLFTTLFISMMFFTSCGDNGNDKSDDSNTNDESTVSDENEIPDNSVIDDETDEEALQDEETQDETNDSDNENIVNTYAGSGAHGDLVVFEIDQAEGTYYTYNETTQKETGGNYEVMTEDLTGMYKISDGENNFYAVELSDKVIAANFDTGNENNTISFGITSELSYTGNLAAIAGDYVYINISNQPVNGSDNIKEWGLISIASDKSLLLKAYATDLGTVSKLQPLAPEDMTDNLPLTSGDISGNWTANSEDDKRVDVYLNEYDRTFTGFVFTENDRSVVILDMGTGNGFILAFKIEDTQLTDIEGEYKFINVWNDGEGEGRSAGKAIISATGTSSFAHLDLTGTLSWGDLENITKCGKIGNMYHATTEETNGTDVVTEKIYFAVLGDIFMAFGFRTDTGFDFASYSAGAKL